MPISIADVAAGPAILLFGVIFGGFLLAMIILGEAVVLRLLRWGTFWRSLRDAAVVNLASALAGFVLYVLSGDLWQRCDGGWCAWIVSPWTVFLLAWLLSVLIEGGLLRLLTKHPPRTTWVAALIMNAASYAVLGMFVLLSSAL